MSLFDDFFRTKEPPKKQIIDVREEIMPVIVSLVKDIPLLSHIDTRRIRLYATQARTDSKHGSYAKIVPMRFPDGKPSRTKKTHTETIQQISGPDGDILYLIYLYVPRFLEVTLEEKMLTLIHELYHISPACDGTIRKVGRGAHGHSRESFNNMLKPIVREYLLHHKPEDITILLREKYSTIEKQYEITYPSLPMPKIRVHRL
ncbi:MAG: putative metallopeptidase [bacterium]